MIRKLFIAFCVATPLLIGLGAPATAGWSNSRSVDYGAFHKHHNACGGVYAAEYRHKHPRYYTVGVKPGRYVWRKKRIRVGTLRRHRRSVPEYRWVRKRVLVRPVRYRVRKHHASGRWVTRPAVIKGQARWRRRGRC